MIFESSKSILKGKIVPCQDLEDSFFKQKNPRKNIGLIFFLNDASQGHISYYIQRRSYIRNSSGVFNRRR